MEVLLETRRHSKASIERVHRFSVSIPESTLIEAVEVRLDRLEDAWKDFTGNQFDLHQYHAEEGYGNPEVEFEQVEAKFIEAKSLLLSFLRGKTPRDSLAVGASHRNSGSAEMNVHEKAKKADEVSGGMEHEKVSNEGVRGSSREIELPAFKITPFGGDYREWPCFRDMFLGSIDCRKDLSGAQKFRYLKSFLRDDPANLLNGIFISDANYLQAWEKLERRYDRPLYIINQFIEMFLNMPSVSTPDHKQLRKLIDNADEVIRGLAALGSEGRDPWLTFLLISKTDSETRQAWALHNANSEEATIDQLIDFLENRCCALETSESKLKVHKFDSRSSKPGGRVKSLAVMPVICPKCGNNHPLYNCSVFIDMTVVDRRSFVKDKKLCYNCLGTQHSSSRCQVKSRCFHCGSRHHSLVHLVAAGPSGSRMGNTLPQEVASTSSSTQSIVSNHSKFSNPTSVIMPTAIVRVLDASGKFHELRALLDTGSQVSFVTNRAVRLLGLSRSYSCLPITGIGAVNAGVAQGVVFLQMTSRLESSPIHVQAFVLNTITSNISPISVPADYTLAFNGLKLADPGFVKPGPIDILLGSDTVWSSLRDGHQSDHSGHIVAHNTVFGWVIAGKFPGREVISMHVEVGVEQLMKSFWEIEEVAIPVSATEDFADKHFEQTFSRAEDNKYTVELPFRHSEVRFQNTVSAAVSRLFSLERRFAHNENLRLEYSKFMQTYEELGHMTRIPDNEVESNSGQVYYLPHHAVVTNKMRVVFNGSYKDSAGLSLNDALYIGPALQRNLLNVFIQFRLYRYVFCADIVKMFRQIWVHPKHRDFQRIVWRKNPTDPVSHYRLNTVTYGTGPAPFLAIRVLKQIAKDYGARFPKAAKAILRNSYVDDFAAGADSLSEVLELRDQLVGILSCGGLELSKWASNSWIIPSSTEGGDTVSLSSDSEWKKVLGIVWNPFKDMFSFKISLEESSAPTKRSLLSEISKVFDPMGFLAPSTILFKMLFQDLWLSKDSIGWDDPLPSEIATKWSFYRQGLECFGQLRIPRRYTVNASDFDLIGFSDASEKAYSAVVYARSVSSSGVVHVQLVTAKTRVAPVKQVSLPRLELCGALLLSRIIQLICSSLENPPTKIYAFTDSTIVLAWLSSLPRRWTTFVANRTAEILDTLPRSVWNHVCSEENPADSASRGVEPRQLLDLGLWWHGPDWLSTECDHWPAFDVKLKGDIPEERKRPAAALVSSTNLNQHFFDELSMNVSSWRRLVRIVAYILRFIRNCHDKSENRYHGFLTSAELRNSKLTCLRFSQREFTEEVRQLKKQSTVSTQSTLASLSPFVDEEGLLRVGGRISNAPFVSFSMKHPIILPKNHNVSKLILSEAHIKYLHAGVSELFSVVRQEYWIIGARNMIRKVVHDCLPCFKMRSSVSTQLMGNLPSSRLSPSFAFAETGCDYAGPFMLRTSKLRKAKLTKGYFALFICMATKALHLEVVSDLTTEAFIAALRRFIARRGKCKVIHSDNGTNFQGAARKLSEVYALVRSSKHNELVSNVLAEDDIKWEFIPPHAPHFGGLWEAGVKSVKQHLRRSIGDNVLTFEEMNTLLAQIEALLNSRPLCAISDTDLNPLTPSHFIIGRPYTALPDLNYLEVPVNRLGRWELFQNMLQGFWHRWQLDYITTLQQRPKWRNTNRDYQTNDLVVLKEPNLPPSQWILGRIEELHPGTDGHVRVVTIRTKNGTLRRPITKLALLPVC